MSNDVTCHGCGKAFKGERGLRAHQNSRHVAMGCKPIQSNDVAAELAALEAYEREQVEAGMSIADRAGTLERIGQLRGQQRRAAEQLEAGGMPPVVAGFLGGVIGGAPEPISDAAEGDAGPDHGWDGVANPVLGLISGRPVTFGAPEQSDASARAAAAGRDELIRTAHCYAFVPDDVETSLVKVEGRDKWARRMLRRDAHAIVASADDSTVVKVTNHTDGTQTIVSELRWADGVTGTITERVSA